MRIISISGTRNSGKTTAIKALITKFIAMGKSCSIIVNEEGKVIYDEDFISSRKISVEHLRGG